MSKYVQIEKIVEEIIRISSEYPEYAVGSLMPLLPLLIGIFRYKYRSKSSNAILLFIISFILSDIPLWITTSLHIHNLLYSYSRDYLLIIFLTSIYLIRLKEKKDRIILIGFISMMSIVLILQLLGIAEKGHYKWFYGLLLGGVAIGYFVRLLENPKIKDIVNYPFFWFNSGILFFCFSTLMINFFFKFTVTSDIKTQTYYTFKSILEYLSATMFVFFGVGFWNLKNNDQLRSK